MAVQLELALHRQHSKCTPVRLQNDPLSSLSSLHRGCAIPSLGLIYADSTSNPASRIKCQMNGCTSPMPIITFSVRVRGVSVGIASLQEPNSEVWWRTTLCINVLWQEDWCVLGVFLTAPLLSWGTDETC